VEKKGYKMEDKLSHRVLKELVFKFKKTKDKTIFLKILKRIDNLIVSVVNKFIARKFLYQNKEYHQDFYHSAIIGVYRGINTAKESESGRVLQARLIAYMKAEIRNFCDNPKEKKIIFDIYKDTIVSGETVYEDLERELLRERYSKLILDNIITLDEFNLLCIKFVKHTKMKDIMKITYHSDNWIRKKIKSILRRIRVNLCNRNLEEV